MSAQNKNDSVSGTFRGPSATGMQPVPQISSEINSKMMM